MGNHQSQITTYSKLSDYKSVTTDWAHHVGSSSGLITIVVMILYMSQFVYHLVKVLSFSKMFVCNL